VEEEGRIALTQDPQKTPLDELPQVFDSSLKNWITQQAAAILPLLLPGTVYERALDVDIILPTMRVDKVFRVSYDGQEHIVHLEFEAGYDKHLKSRLLIYNAILYRNHRLPVITIVVYPFTTTVAKSPLCIMSHDRPILTFVFQTIALFELNAEEVVAQQSTALYPLLPTMEKVSADLVEQAMRELVEIYHDDQGTLAERFIWTELFLERTTTITLEKKEQIKERLDMFGEVFKDSPMIRKLREEYLLEGRQEGRLEALQDMLVSTVQTRYPDLTELAQQRASQFDKTDELQGIILQVVKASSARAVRKLLKPAPKS
jgi:hypothetical protein